VCSSDLSQSWSVLSGAARPDRSKQAMASVLKHLLQDDNLFLLISPALNSFQMDPGYIRDYPPGVRENGAQYNHAALWAAQAFAELKDPVSMMKIIDSINPIKRTSDMNKLSLYRVEPYVVASDIYAKPAEAGRGGWTWYSGSAGVMYRLILENMLGLKIKANKLEINPCIPKDWSGFSVRYTYFGTKYDIRIINNQTSPESNKKIKVDEVALSGHIINLIDDGKTHEIEVRL
jgi:cellobiose phosphorylase